MTAVGHALSELGGDRYVLRGEIARGGAAVVLRAHDQLTQQDVALKRLLGGSGAKHARLTSLFEREYDTLATLLHPNIVHVHDYGIDAEGPYYTMELLEAGDLQTAAPLPWQLACAVLRDVASALALLHARRLVHRDVSPVNVRFGADGSTRLIDFGASTSFGRTEELIGTPHFVAPECLTTRVVDARTDLYSLGAVRTGH
jgi:serine/threonine-protein kinase